MGAGMACRGGTRHSDREQRSQFAVEAFPLAVLHVVELMPENGAYRRVAFEIRFPIALPGSNIAVKSGAAAATYREDR
ncbi:hypothetical protein [Nocardia asiatica]|uniref:hypothetical protein n=1 Tax=Nocardia asiatica TaxID=209252 RepID=UPI003EE2C4A4